jgi:hypothetical protein
VEPETFFLGKNVDAAEQQERFRMPERLVG